MKTRKTKKQKMGWLPFYLLAVVLAVPSCFEISCIKLTGCELFADDDGVVVDEQEGKFFQLEDGTPSIRNLVQAMGLPTE